MLFKESPMDIAIEAKNIGKRYYLNSSIRARIKNAINPFGKNNNDIRKEFWALKDLNFTIREAESVGIIGSNGAGKSTLLKILSRVTKPTTGSFKTNGRVGALIEVGAGFSPDFTGRENVYLNASILGMSRKEVNAKFDEIVDFAGIEKFMDTPVKHYSSGMYVRLGFAIAAHINPDILLVDEILAVGDYMFQKKCFNKMRSFREHGKTFILVTHDLLNVENNCNRVIYINQGVIRFDGNTHEGISLYLNDVTKERNIPEHYSPLYNCRTTGDIEFLDVKILNNSNNTVDEVISGGDFIVEIEYNANKPLQKPKFEIGIVSDGLTIGQTNTYSDGGPEIVHGKGKIRCTIPSIPLVFGKYFLNIYVSDGLTGADIMVISNAKEFNVINPSSIRLGCGLHGFVRFNGKWELTG
jgi:lipopolysaccharide transport system ATP-binding protein